MFEVRARDRRIAWRFAFDANPPTIATGEFAAALVIARRFFLEAKPPTVATGSGEVTTARAPTVHGTRRQEDDLEDNDLEEDEGDDDALEEEVPIETDEQPRKVPRAKVDVPSAALRAFIIRPSSFAPGRFAAGTRRLAMYQARTAA